MTTGNEPPQDPVPATNPRTPPFNPNQDARTPQGTYARTRKTAERDAEAADLRAKGWTYRRIATHLGVDVHSAFDMVDRALKAIVKEPAENLRKLSLERLDAELARLEPLEDAARAVLERAHVTISANGTIVHHQGEPVIDDGPTLQAIDRLLKIDEQRRKNDESRRKLLGLDEPSRVSIEAEQLGRDINRLLDEVFGPDGDRDDADA